MCVKPLQSRLEGIKKLKPSTTVKVCRCFVEMVNFFYFAWNYRNY